MKSKIKQINTLKSKLQDLNKKEDIHAVISNFTDDELKEIIDIMEASGEESKEANLYWNKVMDRLGEKRYYAKIE